MNNTELKNQFLELRSIDKAFCVKPWETLFGFVYCIENKTNGKKYIGSTYSTWTGVKNPSRYSALLKRSSMYIYEYNKYKNANTSTDLLRSIIAAMIEEGIENFVMYPIAETTKDSHYEIEKYFIDKFDTVNNGYNTIRKPGPGSLGGNRMTIKGKIARSKGIICINLETKEVQVAQSAKLFADKIGTTKTIIKNILHNGLPYRGWFAFFTDDNDRAKVYCEYMNPKPSARTHSAKAKELYTDLYNSVGAYIKDNFNPEMFPGFTKLDPLIYEK